VGGANGHFSIESSLFTAIIQLTKCLKFLPWMLPRWKNAFGWVPFLWGCLITAVADDLIYTIFFSQIYVTATLVYLGLGAPAIMVGGIKGLITSLAHSSLPWDKPLYLYRGLLRWPGPLVRANVEISAQEEPARAAS
jgi:hypothetical protein